MEKDYKNYPLPFEEIKSFSTTLYSTVEGFSARAKDMAMFVIRLFLLSCCGLLVHGIYVLADIPP